VGQALASVVHRRRGISRRTRSEFIAGTVFASPWIIGFFAFLLYPMVASLYYSFTKYTLPQPPSWAGMQNYVGLVHDRFFWQSLGNSMYLTFIGIPPQLVFALFCAVLLNWEIRGQAIWRTIYVLPTLMPAVAGAILWRWLLNPQLGLVNAALALIGIRGPLWLGSATWSKPSLIIMQIWGVGGMTIIYLAALQDVPKTLYEAAELDGASRWRKFWDVTIPMISPVTLFQLITSILWALQFFSQAFILGEGSSGAPLGSLRFYGLYLYHLAFESLRMGYASAMAWILFLISLVITLITLRISSRFTYYEVI
jgi:multiple sugar transport system permease protein